MPEVPPQRTFGTASAPVKVPISSEIQAVLFETDQITLQPGIALSITSEWNQGTVVDNFALTPSQVESLVGGFMKMLHQIQGHQS